MDEARRPGAKDRADALAGRADGQVHLRDRPLERAGRQAGTEQVSGLDAVEDPGDVLLPELAPRRAQERDAPRKHVHGPGAGGRAERLMRNTDGELTARVTAEVADRQCPSE